VAASVVLAAVLQVVAVPAEDGKSIAVAENF
jgi:hypothetical protein